MGKNPRLQSPCAVCNQQKYLDEMMYGELIRVPVADLIRKHHPQFTIQDFICSKCLNLFRSEYIKDLLKNEKGELNTLELEVYNSLKEHELITQELYHSSPPLSLAEKFSDLLASFGGSWKFIGAFVAILIGWIAWNSYQAASAFDPHPYILLNLVLSCIAALQAPIIMMSQNRLENRDRNRAETDFKINLKAEVEIRQLHMKIDQLLMHQWQRLLEIQQIQFELMQEIAHKSATEPGAKRA